MNGRSLDEKRRLMKKGRFQLVRGSSVLKASRLIYQGGTYSKGGIETLDIG